MPRNRVGVSTKTVGSTVLNVVKSDSYEPISLPRSHGEIPVVQAMIMVDAYLKDKSNGKEAVYSYELSKVPCTLSSSCGPMATMPVTAIASTSCIRRLIQIAT